MHKVYLLYWIPAEGEWKHGWEERTFDSQGEAFTFCRDNLELIECADFAVGKGIIVSDGKMVCQECGEWLGPEDQGVYPVCVKCDVWEDCDG